MQDRAVQREDGPEDALKLFFGRICCIVGLLLSAGGFVVATLGASVNLSVKESADGDTDKEVTECV